MSVCCVCVLCDVMCGVCACAVPVCCVLCAVSMSVCSDPLQATPKEKSLGEDRSIELTRKIQQFYLRRTRWVL